MRSETKKMMDYCTYCPKMCRFSCPTSEASKDEAHTPWGKMQLARWLTDKEVPLSPDTVLPIYQCTNCLHCQTYCDHLNDVPASLLEIRKLAVENYLAPKAAYNLGKTFSEHNNPYGYNLLEKIRPKISAYTHQAKSDVVLFPSCHTLHLFPERIQTYIKLFEKLDIRNVTIFDEPMQCCGEPMRSLGFQKEFSEIAEVQFYALKNYRTVVVDGPECCQSIRDEYAKLNLSLEDRAIHLLEFLAPYLEHQNYRTQAKVKGRLAYHDPPFLSRYLKIVDLPRQILTQLSGFQPLELMFAGEDSLSAGVEGAYDVVYPELSDKIALRTVKELSSRGIGKLITACAKTEAKFKALAEDVEVQDIFEFVNEHILKS